MSKICTAALIAWEKYIPVMSPEELEMLKNGFTDWDVLTVAKWQHFREVTKMFREDRIKAAMQNSARDEWRANQVQSTKLGL